MTTGLKLTIVSSVYIIVVFILFAYIPTSSFVVDGGTIISIDSSFDATLSYDDVENAGLLDILGGLMTFSIDGLPWWVSILAVYLPLILLSMGIFGLIRGI